MYLPLSTYSQLENEEIQKIKGWRWGRSEGSSYWWPVPREVKYISWWSRSLSALVGSCHNVCDRSYVSDMWPGFVFTLTSRQFQCVLNTQQNDRHKRFATALTLSATHPYPELPTDGFGKGFRATNCPGHRISNRSYTLCIPRECCKANFETGKSSFTMEYPGVLFLLSSGFFRHSSYVLDTDILESRWVPLFLTFVDTELISDQLHIEIILFTLRNYLRVG